MHHLYTERSSLYAFLKRLFLLFSLLLTSALLTACETDPPKPVETPALTSVVVVHPLPSSTPLATLVPSLHPYTGTLTIRLTRDISSLNPWLASRDSSPQSLVGKDASSETVTSLIFSGLTRLDNHLQPQPDLAESWDVSPDGTQITFHLRQNVFWHDGKPFTADDVVWSYKMLNRLRADNTRLIHIQDAVSSVDLADPAPYTVRFTLKRRYSPLLADLAMPILPSHILSGTDPSKLGDSPFNNAPVGTGPFSFSKRDAGKSILLTSNQAYYEGRPYINRVAFLVAPDTEASKSAVREGKLLLGQFGPLDAEQLVKEGKGVRGGAYDELGYDFIAFNLRPTDVFSDTRVRQAWALALDKQGLAFAATGGGADPVWSDVTKSSWAYNPDVPKLGGDPAAARKLLADAGWVTKGKDGILQKGKKSLEVSLYVGTGQDVRLKAAQAMVGPLRQVGIGLKVQPADFNTDILARISPTARPPFNFDAVMLGWTRTGVDPDSFALFHTSQVPTAAEPNLLNISGFSAIEFDRLAIDARSSYDLSERHDKYARMQTILADQLPYYFLWSEKFGVVAGPSLKGDIDFTSPRFIWNIEQWWLQ
ncbi:MAG: ABC transporter substrate-binding protein [Chloroflexota bacterium]|nr:ABC transporter substrate-binding protein [Chloroflexota bacterium]